MEMTSRRRLFVVYGLLLVVAFAFRLFVALRLPNDTPGDGVVYAQIARNVLEQHVYSHESEAPFVPSLIRLPGYPLFLAGIYSISGHTNNTAVRVAQAVIDTATCVLIALVAFLWVDDEAWKQTAAIAAFTLAALCPFTSIYVATILTEVPTNFLAVAMCLIATLAFSATSRRKAFVLWFLAGLTSGLAVLFRPDSGLFAAAIGFTIVISAIAANGTGGLIKRLGKAIPSAAIFSVAFCLILVPWTIRNRRVFGLFQPLSPAHGEMPGEFVPRGYLMWLRTWLDDGRYIGPVLWRLDSGPIKIDAFPAYAFDSQQERERVEALMERYNHPVDQSETSASTATTTTPLPAASPEPSPEGSEEGNEESSNDELDYDPTNVEMTADIDAGFAELARERITRSSIRYYVQLPLKRAKSLWFDTHSQYYPFEGDLLPLEDLDDEIHQQWWLPLFTALTWAYSILGVIGAWFLWRSRSHTTRRWLLLVSLIVFVRIGFFSTLENPEPRYVVEVFPFLSILGGVAIAYLLSLRKPKEVVSQELVVQD